jgi:CheY-like chemotaxis protein
MNVRPSYRILHVCRDVEETHLLRALYAGRNVSFFPAASSASALRQARNAEFDLFLLETRLPDRDGFATCRALRSMAPATPVVFYTGDALERDRSKAFSAGAADYLVKPHLETLIEVIDRLMSSAFTGAAVREPC